MIKVNKEDRPDVLKLFKNLKENLSDLDQLIKEINECWYEDNIYRFYHQSFKIYFLQEITVKIVKALKMLLPEKNLNEWFVKIISDGTDKEFQSVHNDNWLNETRPILEAFFHAKYFLEMAVKYGNELEYPSNILSSGWASILCLYNLR